MKNDNVVNNNQLILLNFIKEVLDINSEDNLMFFTLRFKDVQQNIEACIKKHKEIMSKFHRKLQGNHWIRKPFKSVSIVENGKNRILHVHMIINVKDKEQYEIKKVLEDVISNNRQLNLCFDMRHLDEKNFNFNPNMNHLLIEDVYDINKLIKYVLKEYHWNSRHLNFDNFYPYNILFNINNKND